VDGHLVQIAGDNEQMPGERWDRAVAGRLDADRHAVAARELDGLAHIGCGADGNRGRRLHLHGEVPRRDQLLVHGVMRLGDDAGHPGPQGIQ
jgi:hypothetical protein